MCWEVAQGQIGIHSDICEKSRSCRDELCNTENGQMIVELYLGKQEHHVSRILH